MIETYAVPKLFTQLKLRSSSYNYSEPRNYQKKYTAKLQNSKQCTQFLCPNLQQLPSPVLAQVKIRSSTGSRAQELPRIISTKQGWFSWFRWPYYCQTQFQYSLEQFSPRLFPKVSMWPHLVPVQPQLMTTFIKLSWYHSCPSKSESWLNKQSYHWQCNNEAPSPS